VIRLAYIVSHPIQYQAPLLRRIAAEPDIDLTALFLSDFSTRKYRDKGFGQAIAWDVDLLSGYDSKVLRAWGDADNVGLIQPFTIGGTSQGMNMPDNIAFQPGTGNAIVHEDAETTFEFPHNNDLWDCLPDMQDQDLLSDGCIRIATLNDLTAEWTGGIFDASGQHFYVSIQHNISGQATILDITGWR